MTDLELDIQKAIAERNYSASAYLLDDALQEGSLLGLITKLEEINEAASLLTLEFRDHIFHYLGMWDIYFAVQIPSIVVLKILHENNIEKDAQVFMIDYIRGFLDAEDFRFDQFCVEVETISRGQYAILVPSILEQRATEFENCKIQFRKDPTLQYCTADLLKTYYGNKIVSATHKRRTYDDIVVYAEQFSIIEESLLSAGLDIASMLEEIDYDSWDNFVSTTRNFTRVQLFSKSGELSILRRVVSARSNIFADNFRQQVTALNAIVLAKTQSCNDVLMAVASDSSHQIRRRVLKHLGESGDSATMEFLAGVMKNDDDESIRTEAARAYSMLTSSSQFSNIALAMPPLSIKPPTLDISKIYRVLNNLISRSMPSTMIDDTLTSIAIQGGSDAIDILTRLLAKPQVSVRMAVIKASRSLDNASAASIVRAALDDESVDVVALAEKELDTRWPDAVWD